MRVIDRNGLVYESIDYSPYLVHHGILGQKWGVRHKRYPLSASEHTSSEKKAGWKKSLISTKSKTFTPKVSDLKITTGGVYGGGSADDEFEKEFSEKYDALMEARLAELAKIDSLEKKGYDADTLSKMRAEVSAKYEKKVKTLNDQKAEYIAKREKEVASIKHSEWLAHHGIKGMHWGIRRYQPYPGDYHGDGRFIGKKSKRDQIKESHDKEYWSLWKQHDKNVDSRLKELSKTDPEARRILSMPTATSRDRSKQASAIDDYMATTNDPKIQKMYKDLASQLARNDRNLEKDLNQVNKDFKAQEGDRIGQIYQDAIKRGRALTDKERQIINDEYISRMKPSELKAIAKALDYQEQCSLEANAAFRKYESECRKDPETRKLLDEFSGDGSEYYDLMQERHPNARVEEITHREYEAMVNTDRLVIGITSRLESDYTDLEFKPSKISYNHDTPYSHAKDAVYDIGDKEAAKISFDRKKKYLKEWEKQGYSPKDMVDDKFGITKDDVDRYYQEKDERSRKRYASRAKSLVASGATYAEIAKKLGIPVSSVGYYLNM